MHCDGGRGDCGEDKLGGRSERIGRKKISQEEVCRKTDWDFGAG